MKQSQIYEYLGLDNDPIFKKINDLKEDESINLSELKITLNKQGLYEVETDDKHECFKTKKEVYDGVSKLLSLIVLWEVI